MFDWHRFAREVWDWWWYPFDLSSDLLTAVTTVRAERDPNGDTPLLERYFDAGDFDAKERAYVFRTMGGLRANDGIFGDASSPSTFRLESENVPIYASANGELVAARFPETGNGVSMAFLLLRHEIFHRPNTLMIEIEDLGSFPAYPGRIDYDQEPDHVYSLVMHIGRPEGMSFSEVTDANPDWLNRVLIRKKESDLMVEFYDRDPLHGGIDEVLWNNRPPPGGQRPTLLESWRADHIALGLFLDTLRTGGVAVANTGRNHETSIRVLLGDYLGRAGVIRNENGIVLHGVRLEVFAPGFVAPGFASYVSDFGWSLPGGAPIRPPPAIMYQSEWAKTPSAADRAQLEAIGVNPDFVRWWPDALFATLNHPTLPATGRLNEHGYAFHYEPLKFMRWLNDTTWASEWPKYQVTDANGVPVPQSPDHLRPRSRSV